MTTTAGLVKLTVQAIREARTDAGDQVFSPGDWPTIPKTFPNLLVRAIREEKTSLGLGGIEFTVVTTIRISGRVAAPAQSADAGGTDAEVLLWRLQRQVECAVINYDGFFSFDSPNRLQQYPSIRAGFSTDATGQLQLGEILIDLDMEYYQGPEDFYPTVEAPIGEITGNVSMPAGTIHPGFDTTISQS